MKTTGLLTLLLASSVALAACDSGSVTDEPVMSLRLAIENGSTIQPTAADKSAADISITSARVLLKSVQFHYEDSTVYEFKTGPFAVSLDPDGSETDVAIGSIPEGIVKRITFKIHKPEETEPIPDPDFREGTSGRLRYSMLIQGNAHGTPFDLKIRKTMDQRIEFSPRIDVSAGDDIVVQLRSDASKWFLDEDGLPLDPADDSASDDIADAIKDSFRHLSVR